MSNRGGITYFRVRDRDGQVRAGHVRRPLPDPFRAGREIVVDVRKQGGPTSVGRTRW